MVKANVRITREGSGKPIGRNERCPCGSGKKFKNCHLVAKREQERQIEHDALVAEAVKLGKLARQIAMQEAFARASQAKRDMTTNDSLFGGDGNDTLDGSGGSSVTLGGSGGNDSLPPSGGPEITLFPSGGG